MGRKHQCPFQSEPTARRIMDTILIIFISLIMCIPLVMNTYKMKILNEFSWKEFIGTAIMTILFTIGLIFLVDYIETLPVR